MQKFFFLNMFYWSPHNVWAQKIRAHPPSSTRNLGTKSAIRHFSELWNLTLKKLESLSSLMKHMFCWSPYNVWAHPLPLLQLDIWAKSRLSDTSKNYGTLQHGFSSSYAKIRAQKRVCLILMNEGTNFW